VTVLWLVCMYAITAVTAELYTTCFTLWA
jgi:hypothetical protein